MDKPYISLDIKIETHFLLLSLHRESEYWIKKVLTKQSLLTLMAQMLLFLIFLKIEFFFWNSVESSDF